jgi:hypothetical protein
MDIPQNIHLKAKAMPKRRLAERNSTGKPVDNCAL